MTILLASTSPYRRALLERLGIPFRLREPKVDEETLKGAGLPPRQLAERLARLKALSLADEEPNSTIIGADQVAAFRGTVFGKPGSVERAVEQLTAMTGATHTLITALAVWHKGQVELHTDVTTLQMRALTREEIVRYVEADHPLDCAGAYKLEQQGILLFDRIQSEDQTAITGLPLIALVTILRRFGYQLP